MDDLAGLELDHAMKKSEGEQGLYSELDHTGWCAACTGHGNRTPCNGWGRRA